MALVMRVSTSFVDRVVRDAVVVVVVAAAETRARFVNGTRLPVHKLMSSLSSSSSTVASSSSFVDRIVRLTPEVRVVLDDCAVVDADTADADDTMRLHCRQ